MPLDESQLAAGVAGRYRVEEEIGRGGMAVVYRARDLRHDRTVAIKALRADLSAALGSDRFLREIRIASGLQHPHILPLYDSGSAGDVLYYVMPFVEGETLGQRLSGEGQLGLDEAIRIATEIGEALEYAHRNGFVHRDIKPDNVFLSSGHAIVADFGVARAISEAAGDEITRTGVALGTPAYMSPEQASGERVVDGRCDVYALGCVLFEMLAGEPPFSGRTTRAVLARQMVEEPPSIEAFRPGLPPALATTIATALAKSPADRFESAGAFVEALREAVESPEERVPWVRRWWLIPLLIGGGALAALATGWLTRTSLPETSPHRIVVFPLEQHGLSDESGAGSEAAFLINTALEHSGPLKWIDGWRWLSAEEREAGAQLAPAVARRISLDRGAGYFIDGEIRSRRDSVAVVLRLNDVRGDSMVARASATGPASEGETAALTLTAVRRILPQLADPGRQIDLSAIADRKVGAIALFLQGERYYRTSRYRTALRLYTQAVEADSAFAYAAAKGALAGSWLHREEKPAADRLLRVALAHESLLPPKYSEFIKGLGAYEQGLADMAAVHVRRALELDPEWAEAWTMLGEVHYHLLPSVARPDSVAREAFERAVAVDSDFAPPLYHLAESALAAGRSDEAWRYYRAYVEFGPPPEWVNSLTLSLRCASSGSDRLEWDDLVEADALTVLKAARELSVGVSHPECATDAFGALLRSGRPGDEGFRWAALFGYQGLLVARGRDSAALAVLDSADAAGDAGPFYLYFLDEIAGAPFQERADRKNAWAKEETGDLYQDFGGPMGLWHLGAWNAQRGNLAEVSAIARSLREIADSTGRSDVRMFADATRGHLALLEADTAAAITEFAALVSVYPQVDFAWQLAPALAPERLSLARLLLARGRYEEALDAASIFDHPAPVVFLPFVPPSLAVRYGAARALGRRTEADAYRERLRALGRLELIEGPVSRSPSER